MDILRKAILIGLALILAVVTVVTWGSLGSILTGFCLVMMIAALLVQRFLTNRDPEDFQAEG